MKIKYLFLFIPIILVYLIYNLNYTNTINIVSINSDNNNYYKYLSNYFNNSKMNYNYNIDYTSNYLEIENLSGLIDNNDKLKNIINNSDILLLSIGNIDIQNEDITTIIKELNELFKKIRKINSKEIIYISPYNIKNTAYIKELCQKYNILFVNGINYKRKELQLALTLYRKIESKYNNKKY